MCPKCNGKTSVIESRNRKSDNDIRRRRKCIKCDYLFTTYERLSSFKPKIKEFKSIKDFLEFINIRNDEVNVESIILIYGEAYYKYHKNMLDKEVTTDLHKDEELDEVLKAISQGKVNKHRISKEKLAEIKRKNNKLVELSIHKTKEKKYGDIYGAFN
jgi:hypothetical protein